MYVLLSIHNGCDAQSAPVPFYGIYSPGFAAVEGRASSGQTLPPEALG